MLKSNFRICNPSDCPIDVNTISKSSDLCLQFDNRTDAKDFLQQLPIPNQFIQNYAEFQFVPSSNYKNLDVQCDESSLTSELGFYGMKMLVSLGYIFTDKYLLNIDKFRSEFISIHKQSDVLFYKLCYTLWTRLQADHCCDIFDNKELIPCILPQNQYLVPHVIITPLRIWFKPMHSTTGHRAMRQYTDKKSYKWMLVYMKEEDGENQISNFNGSVDLRERYKKFFKNGLSVDYQNLTFCYFGSSCSQMKKQEFWFMSPMNTKSADAISKVIKIRQNLGNLKAIKNIATYIARVGLYLTTSKPTDVRH